MATSYTEWLPAIQPHVPACPSPMIIEMVRQACIDFCESSGYLRVNLDAFNTVADDDTYELTAPVDTVVCRVLHVRCGDRTLEATTQEVLEQESNYWRDKTGQPNRYIQPDQDTIILNPVPDAVEAVNVFATVRPSQASGGVDDQIFERFKDRITSGALARLMAMPGLPWSNAELSAYHAGIYNGGVSDAADSAARGLTNAVRLRVRPRFL